jgi:hypothetical protein
MGYFRTELPRLFVSEEQAGQLIASASKIRVGQGGVSGQGAVP